MLSPEAEKVRRELLRVHGITPETRRLAEVAAGFWARAEEAGARVTAEGLTISNGRGTFVNPAVTVEKNARLGFLTAVRALRQQPKRTKIGRPTLTERWPPHPSRLERKYLGGAAPKPSRRYITPLS